MLNVLIAVVRDSYEKSTLKAKTCSVEHVLDFWLNTFALEQFLQPGWYKLKSGRSLCPACMQQRVSEVRHFLHATDQVGLSYSHYLLRFCCRSLLIRQGCRCRKTKGLVRIHQFRGLRTGLLFDAGALWIVFDFLFNKPLSRLADRACLAGWLMTMNTFMVKFTIRITTRTWLFGGMTDTPPSGNDDHDDEWAGMQG